MCSKKMLMKVEENDAGLRSKLTFYPKGTVQQRDVYAFRVSGDKLLVPLFTDRSKYDVATCMPEGSFSGELRPHQGPAAHAIYGDLEQYGSALAYLYTGWGKTAMALYVASCFPVRVVVYVHKVSLVSQWLESAQMFVPHMTIEVRTVQKQLRNLHELYSFGGDVLVIFDECHHYAAHSFSQLLVHSRARYHLALSASEHRSDGLEEMLLLYFGRPSAVDTRLRVLPAVKVARYDGGQELYTTRSMTVRGQVIPDMNHLLNNLAACDDRNRFIVDILSRLEGRCILVLTKRRQHACDLAELCRTRLPCEVRLLLGGMKADEVRDVKLNALSVVLVATSQSAGEGFDMPCLDTLVIALPCSSVQQEVGRILRRSGEKQPWVVDVVDASPITNSQFMKRRKFYLQQGMTIESLRDEIA